jgi:hypothetical protein
LAKPLCIDLFCGLGGWAEGFLSEGYDVIGFDIERHDYGTGGYPGQLVLQDVLTLDGRQFRNAAVIVASPPCQAYSYMAMPWSRAKALAREREADVTLQLPLNCLFNACFRIAHEAGVPLIVENVRGAERWVGPARWHFGSFYLWGDVPPLMPFALSAQKKNPDGTNHGQGSWFAIADSKNRGAGGSWFNIGREGQKVTGVNPDGRLIQQRNGHRSTRHLTNPTEHGLQDGSGQKVGGDWFGSYAEQKAAGTISPGRLYGKNSDSRKAASAQIAKIPFPLAQHIAKVFKP